MRLSTIFGTLALASYVYAVPNATYCWTSENVCYAVNVPPASALNGTGDIFFQITAPSNLSWVGFGQGTSMTGGDIFVIYANAAGNNVTLSARSGTGHKPPALNSTTKVTLLAGSEISQGVMTANVKCSNCNSWSGGTMSFTDRSSNWIWAFKIGAPIASDDPDAAISMHTTFGLTTLDLQSATGGSSSDPFLTPNKPPAYYKRFPKGPRSLPKSWTGY